MDSDQLAPPKRMRLGTRSCVECRRRKVRCVFQETSNVCDACILHDAECLAQQPPAAPKSKPATTLNLQPQMGEDGTSLALLKRLDEMENMIKQIRSGATTGTASVSTGSLSFLSSSPSTSSANTDRSNSHQQQPLTATSTPGSKQLDENIHGTEISRFGASDALGTFGNTPLVSFFRHALNLPEGGGLGLPPSTHLTNPSRTGKGTSLFQKPAAPVFAPNMLLSENCLRAVLDITSQCFVVFPPCSFYQPRTSVVQSPDIMTPQLNRSDPASILADLHAALWSENTEAAAKALLWMCLCLFELPRAWTCQYPELSDTLSLIDLYRRQAASMLAAAAESGDCTRHTVEARCLEVKLNVDLGFPRKAWLSARRAVSACLLLAYHRASKQDKPHEQSLWHMALHVERETSMILGLPSSVSNQNKCLLPILPPDEMQISPEFRLLHEMTTLLGSVSDLYQTLMAPPVPGTSTDNLGSNYGATIVLDQEWESLRRIMPQEFWQEDATSPHIANLQPVDLYIRQTTKMRYFIMGRHIHLPYALRASRDRRYGYSRTACLEASRNVIQTYQTLRRLGSAQWAPCGLQDFESFSAAMVIILTMLQDTECNPGQARSQRSRQEEDDFNLLMELSLTFRKAYLLKASCAVAQRAADVMDIVLPIIQGQYQRHPQSNTAIRMSTADHDITIPFFGRLRVTFPQIHTEAQPSPLSSLSSPTGHSLSIPDDTQLMYTDPVTHTTFSDLPIPPPMIEFGVPYCNHDFHLNFDPNLELNSDWMSSVDSGVYDWTTLFAPASKQ